MYIIGITGPVGSGKTTIAKQIETIFGDVSILSMDNYFKAYSNLSLEDRKKINFDDPKTYDIDLLLSDIDKLKRNETIHMPIYSFEKYERTQETQEVLPRRVLVIEGFACLHNKRLRDLLDYSIFVNIDEITQIKRLIDRNIKDRCRSLNDVLMQYVKNIQKSNNKFCMPQMKYADLVIDGSVRNQIF